MFRGSAALFASCAIAASASAALWEPDDLSGGLVAWYDASDASTITTNSGNVTDWLDKSGNGVHLTQATVGDQPSVVSGAMNGLDVLEFANRTEDMDAIVGGNPVLIDAKWAAVVLQYNGSPAFSQALGSQNASGGDNYTIQYRGDVNPDRWQGGYVTNGNPESVNGAAVNINPTIVIHDDINLTNFRLQVGGDRGINNRGWDGYIAEVILGNQILTTEDRQTLEGYLAHKWMGANTANPLPGDHPHKTEAPVPEPTSLALLAMGGLLIARRRRN